jgi:hypothetical protein
MQLKADRGGITSSGGTPPPPGVKLDEFGDSVEALEGLS